MRFKTFVFGFLIKRISSCYYILLKTCRKFNWELWRVLDIRVAYLWAFFQFLSLRAFFVSLLQVRLFVITFVKKTEKKKEHIFSCSKFLGCGTPEEKGIAVTN